MKKHTCNDPGPTIEGVILPLPGYRFTHTNKEDPFEVEKEPLPTTLAALMREYIENKKAIRKLKSERSAILFCKINIENPCFDGWQMRHGLGQEPCDPCVDRLKFRKQIDALHYRQVAIMNRVRAMVNKPEFIGCVCPDDLKTGETSIMCCNHCGKPTEDFWINQPNNLAT